jgi:ADP-ribosylglycohydrolase
MRQENLHHSLLGGALGDSLGLPAEGLSAKRVARLWPGPLRHRFLFLHTVLIHGFRRLLPPY